jgi:hypothetical protein
VTVLLDLVMMSFSEWGYKAFVLVFVEKEQEVRLNCLLAYSMISKI